MALTVLAAKALLAVSIACGSAPVETGSYTVCAVKVYHGVSDTIDSCDADMVRRASEDGAYFLREGLGDVNSSGVCADGPITAEKLKGIEQVVIESYSADKIKTRHYRVQEDGQVIAMTPEGFPK